MEGSILEPMTSTFDDTIKDVGRQEYIQTNYHNISKGALKHLRQVGQKEAKNTTDGAKRKSYMQ